jgi:hypothetical protein
MTFDLFLTDCFNIVRTDVLEEYLEEQVNASCNAVEETLNKLERDIWNFIHCNNLETIICENVYWDPFLQSYVMVDLIHLKSKSEVLGMILRYIAVRKIH